jgi:hypothetical protein
MMYRLAFYCLCAVAGWAVSEVVTAAIDREPPIQYIEARALASEVEAGQTITILYDVERSRICRVMKVDRFITDKDGKDISIATYEVARTRPGRERYDREITIPETVPPGPASYYIRIQYGCSWLQVLFRPLVVESPRVPFLVRPATPP